MQYRILIYSIFENFSSNFHVIDIFRLNSNYIILILMTTLKINN